MPQVRASLDTREAPSPAPSGAARWVRIGLLAAVAVGAIWLLRSQGADLVSKLPRWVEGLGVWGPIAFIGGYALAAVAFVPGSILTLAAGPLFGLWKGVACVLAAATLGASAAFLIARYLARGAVERKLAGNARFAAIDRAVGAEGLKIVFLLRLSPVFPYNLLNYALGLTKVRFTDFFAASIGMLPGTFLYVYLGKIAGDAAKAAGGASEADVGIWIVRILGLLATVVVTTIVTRTARRALREATGDAAGVA
jgi:uncharacterized membrane protein YdjX (TVP38/TMEM64 family)